MRGPWQDGRDEPFGDDGGGMRLVAGYYAVRPWEPDLYRRLGVRQFRKLVPIGDWTLRVVRRFKPGFRVVHDRQSAQAWTIFTLVAETAHVLFGALMTVLIVEDAVTGEVREALFYAAVNLVVNCYPAILQRYNRERLVRLFRLDLRDAMSWEL